MSDNSDLLHYSFTNDLITDAKVIIETAQKTAYRAVDSVLVLRNWMLGQRIAMEEMKGENRAEYGNESIARTWYAQEAYAQTWSVRTLQRNIDSQYYFRMLMSQDKKPVEDEMNSFLHPITNYTYRRKKSCGQKLKLRKLSSGFSRK